MARVWDADVEVTEALVGRLIESQFPDLAPVRLEWLGSGWDNVAYRVNDRYVFRFPRRRLGAALMERETAFLPELAARLPLPIPCPEFAGRPEGDYPYPFAGYPMLPGVTGCAVPWTDALRDANARALGRFLGALHRIPISEEIRRIAPGDEIERANLPKRAALLRDRGAALRLAAPSVSPDALFEVTDALAQTPSWPYATCWVHGDLYPRHLLFDAESRLCGVIDWGDLHLGDPALDLAVAFTFLSPESHAVFRKAYGQIDDDTWRRAQFRALHYGVVLTVYGAEVGDEEIRALGIYALRPDLRSPVAIIQPRTVEDATG